MRCPFKTYGMYCTHIANKNAIKNGKRTKCIYSISNCPYLNAIKEKKDAKPSNNKK